jgi:DNA-binding transcriptional MerR regulator
MALRQPVVKILYRLCRVTDVELLRIGELSRRSGVSPELLRAWERRYGLLSPQRSGGGLRLYSLEDLERVQAMRRHLAEGLAAAEAAALAAGSAAAPALDPAGARAELAAALDGFDEPQAQATIDRLLAAMTQDTLLTDIVLPYLRDLGERWERGEASIAHEHFASMVLRGRLLGLARGWGRGAGPLALLACLPAEHHDFGLIACGLALRERGWRIAYLGTDAPIETVADMSRRLDPRVVVLSAVSGERVRPVAAALRAFVAERWLALGGAAAHDAAVPGVLSLSGDPVAEAERLTLEAAPAPG